MFYGGDYNPDQWPEEIWADDIERMLEAGVNLVSLGIFSWARIQPAEGVFDFDWLDDIIGRLHAAGIGVDLATATASPPPWAHEKYPELLPVDASGSTLGPGSRQHYAPSSPVYRRLASEVVTAIAERYVKHPGVVMWHINNEYGCHLQRDYSDNAAVAFRDWLRERYETIDGVNTAWGTSFWSQIYTDFAQVLPPRLAPYSVNPAQQLDFRRFSSDMLLECYLMEKQILLAAGATQPITTNFMGLFEGADYWKWAQHVDFISDDAYPDPNDPQSFRTAGALPRDLMRSLGDGRSWVLMEQASNALNWRPTNAPKAPGQMEALSMQAVARGADGILFFQWRQSRSGAEKFHSAMLPHAGTRTRTWREIVALGGHLGELPTLAETSKDARVALVFDWESWWAISNSDHPVVLDYKAIIDRWYAAFHTLDIQIDFVHPSASLEGYALVVAPQLYLLTDASAANLVSFVEGGGHLFVGAFSDVVDENDAFRDGGYLRQLGETLGIWVEDFGALVAPGSDAPGENSARVTGSALARGLSLTGEYLAEEIHVTDAEVLGTFTSGRRTGDPAFTRRVSGEGRAYYLATLPDAASAIDVAWLLAAEAGVEPVLPDLPEFVEAARRGDVVTIINHGDESVTVAIEGTLVQTGEATDAVSLAPYEWAMVRTA